MKFWVRPWHLQAQFDRGGYLVKKKMPSDSTQTSIHRSSNDDGLLMPILYALLAAVGGFTLVMFIGIGARVVNGPPQAATVPSARPSIQDTLPSSTLTQAPIPPQVRSEEPSAPNGTQNIEPSQPSAEQTAVAEQTSVPEPTPAPQIIRGLSADTTVYVSQSGKIHSISNCSGMRYYSRKTLGDADATARRGFYSYCSNCW